MTVLGVDPGRNKVGWALTSLEGDLVSSGICCLDEQYLFLTALSQRPARWAEELSPWVTEKVKTCNSQPEGLSFVAVGNGTGSLEMIKLLERLGVRIVVVDESGTTLEARELYWSLHAPSWWQRCVPNVMRFPPRPLDDLAAWAIARRSLAKNKEHGAGRE